MRVRTVTHHLFYRHSPSISVLLILLCLTPALPAPTLSQDLTNLHISITTLSGAPVSGALVSYNHELQEQSAAECQTDRAGQCPLSISASQDAFMRGMLIVLIDGVQSARSLTWPRDLPELQVLLRIDGEGQIDLQADLSDVFYNVVAEDLAGTKPVDQSQVVRSQIRVAEVVTSVREPDGTTATVELKTQAVNRPPLLSPARFFAFAPFVLLLMTAVVFAHRRQGRAQ